MPKRCQKNSCECLLFTGVIFLPAFDLFDLFSTFRITMILQFQTDCYHNIQLLKDDKEQAVKDKEEAEKCAEKAEKDLHSLEERRERLQPVMDNVSKEIKEYGTVKTLLPEAGALERATTYRDKKIKPLFTQVKNKIAAMAAQVKELAEEVEKWKHKYLGENIVENAVQQDIQEQKALEEKRQMEQMPTGSIHERLAWGARKSSRKAALWQSKNRVLG